jgi:hypothetical protein
MWVIRIQRHCQGAPRAGWGFLVFGVIAAERQSEDTAIGGLGALDSLERHASIGIGIRCSWGLIVDRLDG